jgi:hypothetical protein
LYKKPTTGEGYALLIRGRRELRDARDEIDGLRRGMDELEEVRAGWGVAVAGCSWDRWKEGGGAVRTVVVATW